MIPSFSIIGIDAEFESMAKKIQDYASSQVGAEGISEMISRVDGVCTQACRELQEEFDRIKARTHEQI